MPPKTQRKNNPGKGEVLEATMLVSMFKETIETNAELTARMGIVCDCLKENTGETKKLLNHLSGIPVIANKIKGTVNLIKWGLIPVIMGLIGLTCFFAARGG
jgi:hypothetical protein